MEGMMMGGDLDVLLRVLNAGGNVAVAVILWVSARYLSEQLNTAYRRITEAHEATVRILVDVVGENTRALTRTRDAIDEMSEVVTANRKRLDNRNDPAPNAGTQRD